jgi:hypothetical protein
MWEWPLILKDLKVRYFRMCELAALIGWGNPVKRENGRFSL